MLKRNVLGAVVFGGGWAIAGTCPGPAIAMSTGGSVMGLVVMAGQITTRAVVDYTELARAAIKRIGYNSSDIGFDCSTCAVVTAFDKQSVDIAQGVDGELASFEL